MIPGEYHVASEPIDYNGGYEAISLEVKNVGDRAAQVGSHYHFYEANEAGLQFYDNVINECLRYGIEPLITISQQVQPFVLSQVKRKQYNLLTLEGNVVFLVSITRSMVS